MAAVSRVVAGRDTRPIGTIFVSVPHFLFSWSIAADLTAFGNANEEIEIHFGVTDGLANLERREADVSIRYAHEVTEDVVGRILVHCTEAVYCAPEYAAKVENNGDQGLQWIGWNEEETAKAAAWVKLTAYPNAILRHRVMEGNAYLALAKAGLGPTFIPCFVVDAYQGLIRAPFQTHVSDRKLWPLFHRDLRETARVRLLNDFLAERITIRRVEFIRRETEPSGALRAC
jgi:DNA-binding transcriptional LysR family regulator